MDGRWKMGELESELEVEAEDVEVGYNGRVWW